MPLPRDPEDDREEAEENANPVLTDEEQKEQLDQLEAAQADVIAQLRNQEPDEAALEESLGKAKGEDQGQRAPRGLATDPTK